MSISKRTSVNQRKLRQPRCETQTRVLRDCPHAPSPLAFEALQWPMAYDAPGGGVGRYARPA
eukprot:4460226-Prymnesium_polylepis.1